VPTIDTGTASSGISEARQVCRNRSPPAPPAPPLRAGCRPPSGSSRARTPWGRRRPRRPRPRGRAAPVRHRVAHGVGQRDGVRARRLEDADRDRLVVVEQRAQRVLGAPSSMRATSRRRVSRPSAPVRTTISPNSSSVARRPWALIETRKVGPAASAARRAGRRRPARSARGSRARCRRPSGRARRPGRDRSRRAWRSRPRRTSSPGRRRAGAPARRLILQRAVVAQVDTVVAPSGEVRCTTMVRSGDSSRHVTPMRRTSSGRRGSAWLTRFCTCTCAMSGSVPGGTSRQPQHAVAAGHRLHVHHVLDAVDRLSSGAATVSAISCGLAPGYTARTPPKAARRPGTPTAAAAGSRSAPRRR
jgi:hypothetical protein